MKGRTSVCALVFVFTGFQPTIPSSFGQTAIQRPSCRGVVEGRVLSHEGQPVKDFTVRAWPLGVGIAGNLPVAKTDQFGMYRFENVCPGRYTVVPHDEKAGYPPTDPYTYEFLFGHAAAETNLAKAHAHAELDVMLPPKPGILQLHVADAATRAQIVAFKIVLKIPERHEMGEMSVTFNPDLGQEKDRKIAVPPDTDFYMEIAVDGYQDWSTKTTKAPICRVASGSAETVNVQLERVNNHKS